MPSTASAAGTQECSVRQPTPLVAPLVGLDAWLTEARTGDVDTIQTFAQLWQAQQRVAPLELEPAVTDGGVTTDPGERQGALAWRGSENCRGYSEARRRRISLLRAIGQRLAYGP